MPPNAPTTAGIPITDSSGDFQRVAAFPSYQQGAALIEWDVTGDLAAQHAVTLAPALS